MRRNLAIILALSAILIVWMYFQDEKKCDCDDCDHVKLGAKKLGNTCTAACTAAGVACQAAAAINFWDEPEASIACTGIQGTCVEACKK